MKPFTLITGASAGIGEATATRLAAEGQNLLLIARRIDRLKKLKPELEKAGVEVRIFELDVTDRAALESFFKNDLKDIELKILVNNAGLALGTESFDAYDFSDVDTMIDVNIRAMARVAHLSLPLLKKSQGHIVNLGSIAGIESYAGGTVYCATKHFVHSFTRGLRQDLLGTGVRVTTIAPGRVETEFSDVRLKGDIASAKKVYQNCVPLQASDIADAICFAVTRPKHVNLELMLVMPTDQAGTRVIERK